MEENLFLESIIIFQSCIVISKNQAMKIEILFDFRYVEILELDPELCKACGEKAGRHNYYGGQVCPSCRAFFRRAVQSKSYEGFVCLKEKKCLINIRTRKSCQFCRFKKCLQAGMKPKWVLPEGQKQKRNSSSNAELNSLSKQPPSLQLTTEDAILIGQMISATNMLFMEKLSKGRFLISETKVFFIF